MLANKGSGNFRFYFSLAGLALCAAGLIFYIYFQYFSYSTLPILGEEPISEVGVVEDHKDALWRWLGQGIKGAVLVNIDSHDDFKKISPQDIQALQGDLPKENIALGSLPGAATQSLVSEGDFIYAAAKLGVVSEVYWVVPTYFFQRKDRDKEFQALMNFHRFQKEEAQLFTFNNGMYSGTLHGIPFHICEISTLPRLHRPILLSFDVDYWPVSATNFAETLLATTTRIFQALNAKRYRIRDAVVAYSVNGGHLRSYHRWLGDMAIDYLKQPALVQTKNTPEKYLILQQAELQRQAGRFSELMQFLFPVLEKDIYNPEILIYMAYALNGLGMEMQAMNCAEKACFNDQNYCYGLCELGMNRLMENGLKSSEPYFQKAYKGNPAMVNSKFEFARALIKAERYDEALSHFNSFRSYYGPLPIDFYIGKTYMLKGELGNAMQHYDSGRQGLLENPQVWASFGDRGLIEDVIQFYEQNGQGNHADELRIALAKSDKYYPNGMPH